MNQLSSRHQAVTRLFVFLLLILVPIYKIFAQVHPPAENQLPQLNSVITGTIRGKIEYDVKAEPDGKPEKMILKFVILQRVNPDGTFGKEIPVKVIHRKYRFTTAPGKKYKVYPANFPSDPKFQIVTCLPHATAIANFTITNHPIID